LNVFPENEGSSVVTQSGIALIAKRITLFSRHFPLPIRARAREKFTRATFSGELKGTFVLYIELMWMG
jgi:hypothetical protein